MGSPSSSEESLWMRKGEETLADNPRLSYRRRFYRKLNPFGTAELATSPPDAPVQKNQKDLDFKTLESSLYSGQNPTFIFYRGE